MMGNVRRAAVFRLCSAESLEYGEFQVPDGTLGILFRLLHQVRQSAVMSSNIGKGQGDFPPERRFASDVGFSPVTKGRSYS
jgi:hypothetical protein